ncbi:MAG: hypothetical protein Q4Q23_00455 [Methanobacteriaceae archaeon]|nr:hypothetical protein [Methanobacteriaceae archaeon]
MKFNTSGVVAILLGLIAIIFPLLGVKTLGLLSVFFFILLAAWLFVAGCEIWDIKKIGAIIFLLLAFILVLMSGELLFMPEKISILVEYITIIAGFVFIIVGILNIIGSRIFKPSLLMGVINVMLGIIYILLGTFLANPIVLGSFIGAWLIINGLFSFFTIDHPEFEYLY